MNKSEKHIFKLIENGFLSVDKFGRIWRHRKWINYHAGYVALARKERAELWSNNYLTLHIKEKGKEYRAKAHRIVWMFFNGDAPKDTVTNHKNGVGIDNRPDNLEMVTTDENVRHAYATGLAHGRKGTAHHNAKLTEDQVRELRQLYATGNYSHSQLATRFKINNTQSQRIVRRERWKHIK